MKISIHNFTNKLYKNFNFHIAWNQLYFFLHEINISHRIEISISTSQKLYENFNFQLHKESMWKLQFFNFFCFIVALVYRPTWRGLCLAFYVFAWAAVQVLFAPCGTFSNRGRKKKRRKKKLLEPAPPGRRRTSLSSYL